MASWYAVHTKPQQEHVADRDIQRLGVPVFYPRQRIRRHIRRNGAMLPVWLTRPYFPRWLFVDTSMDSLWRVKSVGAVSGIASSGTEPIRIPDTVMGVLMAGADAGGIMASRDEVARRRYEAASSVRFMDGTPLAGVIATVIKDDGNVIEVMVGMLGGKAIKAKPEMLQLAA